MNKIKTAAFAVIAGVLAGALFASAQVTTTSSCYQFTRNLKVGNTGADVKALQQTLNARGFTVAAAGHAGSAGMETTYFGNATKNALIKWQEANASKVLAAWGLTSGTGFFGTASRAEMNNCGGSVVVPPTTGTTTVSGPLTVSLAQVQPNNVLVAGQAHAKLADIVFSGTGIVTGVQLQRTGVSNNNVLTNVYLYEGNTKISDGASVMADGSIRFNFGTGLFSVTGSKTISVFADVEKNNTSGQSVGVALTGYTIAGNAPAVVSGVNGPNLPIGSATLADVIVTRTTNQNQANIGDQNVNIWSAGINVLQHDVYFVGGSFRMIGSAPFTALSNVKLYIDGVQVGNAAAIDAAGRLSFSGGNQLVRSGYHTLNVRADVADGAGRTLQLSLEQGSDFLFQDAQLVGAYVLPVNTSNVPFYNMTGDLLTIGACASGVNCTILTADADFAGTAARATTGASNQTIGKFKLTASGEPIRLMSADIDVTSSVVNTDAVTNVSVYVNGMAVSSGATIGFPAASSSVHLNNLGGVVVNPGQSVVIEVKADLRNPNGTNIAGSQNLTVKLNNLQVQGTQSRNISTAPNTNSLQAVVGGTSAVFSKSSSFSGGTATVNAQEVKIGSFTMSSGYAEGVNLTQIDVVITPSGTPSFDRSSISSLTLKSSNGQNYQRTVGSGTTVATTSFSLFDSIPVNSAMTYDVFANFNNATGSVAISGVGHFTGMTSNVVATQTVAAVTTNFGAASLGSITLNSNSDGSQFVTGGTQTKSVFLIPATNGNNVNLNTVELKVSNDAAVAGVKINGQDAVSQGNGNYQVVLNSPIALTSGFGSQLPVDVIFNAPTNSNSLSNTTTKVDITYLGTSLANTSAGTQGTYTGSVAASNTFTSAIAIPTSVKATSGSTVNNGSGIKLGSITVNTNGAIRIDDLTFNTAVANGGAVSNIVIKRGNTTVTHSVTGSVYTLTGGDIVSGNVTYDIYGDIASMGSSGSATVSLGAASAFKWNDSVNTFTGAGIKEYN
ncbi:hypothetical protein SDC9_07938 [bioreactor metagenome]|uniref:Peptidoglycan binding-like domain-containing protein n=1 Tax=bioreactor metagenome TaxID=1076179 RepID=A0A644T680_9ZZZZ|nr:peptidoglycan-binding domain-containing protein [Candidatus Elulimicrobiales bacterium]